MVDILCPHCEEEIALDDDAVGEFSCPYCDGEFEWGETEEEEEADLDFGDFDTEYSGSTGLIYKPAMLAFTLIMVIITVVGLNSDSWYNISAIGKDDDPKRVYEAEFSFGLSGVEVALTITTSAESRTHIETYNYEDEENKILQELEEIDEYGLCDDVAEEEQQQCQNNLAEWKRETTVNLEEWEDWNSSGSLMNFFLVMCLIFFIIILLSKTLLLLDGNTNTELPANLIGILNKTDNISTFVTGILLLIGCVIFAVMSPGEFHMAGGIDDGGGDVDFSDGMGMIWWTTLVLSIGYCSASIRGLVSDFN